MKKRYEGTEISIPHKDMVTLRNSGKLNLGMYDDIAVKIADNQKFAPTSKKSSIAMHFWSWIAVGQFIFSIYKSFTGTWWLFIPSFFLMFVIHHVYYLQMIQKENCTNLLKINLCPNMV